PPLVAVPREAGASHHERGRSQAGGEVATELGARLLQDPQPIKTVEFLFGKLVCAAEVEVLRRAPTGARDDAAAGPEDAGRVRCLANGPGGRDALDGEGHAELDIRLSCSRAQRQRRLAKADRR